MYDNANQGAYQNNGSPRKEIINQWQGVGVLRAKSTDPNAPLRFYSKDGVTGVLHAKIVVTQNSRNKDQNGDAIITKDEFSLDAWTNTKISFNMLRNMQQGTKVRVVGEAHKKHYQDRNGAWQTDFVINAYVLEILATPQQAYQQAPQQGGFAPQGYGQGHAQPNQGYQQAPQQGGFAPQGYGQGHAQPNQGYQQAPQQGNFTPQGYGQGYAQPNQGYQQAPQQGNFTPQGYGQGYARQGGANVQQPVTQTPPAPEDMPADI